MKKILLILLVVFLLGSYTAKAQTPNLLLNCRHGNMEKRCRYVEIGNLQGSNIRLFRNVSYSLAIAEKYNQNGCDITYGNMEGIEYSYFYVVNCSGTYMMHFGSPNGIFEVTRETDKIYRVIEINQQGKD